MSEETQKIDVTSLVEKTDQAEQQGIPVNWRSVAITIHNAAMQLVDEHQKLRASIAEEDSGEDEGEPEDGGS